MDVSQSVLFSGVKKDYSDVGKNTTHMGTLFSFIKTVAESLRKKWLVTGSKANSTRIALIPFAAAAVTAFNYTDDETKIDR